MIYKLYDINLRIFIINKLQIKYPAAMQGICIMYLKFSENQLRILFPFVIMVIRSYHYTD